MQSMHSMNSVNPVQQQPIGSYPSAMDNGTGGDYSTGSYNAGGSYQGGAGVNKPLY